MEFRWIIVYTYSAKQDIISGCVLHFKTKWLTIIYVLMHVTVRDGFSFMFTH